MKAYENKNKEAEAFPIVVELNSGKQYFTIRAAKELKQLLASVIAGLEAKAGKI